MYHGICDSIISIFIFFINIDSCSSIFIDIKNILSSCFISSVSNDSGNIMNDISGTNKIFMIGVNKFISWKLFIDIGMLAMNDIKLVINVFEI